MSDDAIRPVRTLGWRWALGLGLTALALLPSMALLAAALPAASQGDWLAHFTRTMLPSQARSTAWLVAEAWLVAFAVGALPAVMVARYEFAHRTLVSLLVLLPLLLAPHVTASVWMGFFSAAFFEGRHALAIELGLACSPYVFLIFRIASARMPNSFGELAAGLGWGPWQRLWRVHAPAYAVPVTAASLIVLAQVSGDYAAAERLGIETLSIGLHNLWFATQSSGVAALVASVLLVPALGLVLLSAWAATRVLSQAPVPPASSAARRRVLRPALGHALLAWCLLWSVPGFWLPEALLCRWAWLKWGRTRFADIPADLLSTWWTALACVLLVAAICLLCAALMRSGVRSHWLERLPWLFLANYFLPSLVLALAFVILSADGSWGAQLLGPWRDSRLLIVLAAALRYLPFAMLPMLDALRRTPPALLETARAFGAGPWRARASAYAGHLWPALLLGCGLVFMEALKELDLSLTLQPFGYSSTSLKIYAFSRHQNIDRAAIWVLLTQLLMLPPLWLLLRRLRRLDTGSAMTMRHTVAGA